MKTSTQLTRIAFVLAGTVFAAGAYAQTILKFSHTDQQNGARQVASLAFAKKVEEYTQGRYKVNVFCCAQLGNDPKSVEQLVSGGVDFAATGTSTYSTFIPSLNLALLPFLLQTYDQGWKWYDESKWLKAQFDKGPAAGFRFLANWESGFRSLTTKMPLNGPEDAKGKKLRVAPTEIMRWTVEAMGFGAQIMPVNEVYMAIQQGVVIGQDNPIDSIYTNKFFEVAPYITLTNHMYSPVPITISEKTWQKLSPADQQAVTRAAQEVVPFIRTSIRDNDERLLSEMISKGAKVNRSPDFAAFRKAMAIVYDKSREKYGAAEVETVLAETAAIRKAVK